MTWMLLPQFLPAVTQHIHSNLGIEDMAKYCSELYSWHNRHAVDVSDGSH